MSTRMSRRDFFRANGAALLGSAFGLTFARGASAEKRMNVVCILCDDMGAQELGCYGSAAHRTPNLDALAESGARFETFYATPVCSPTRVCLMTGRYGFRTGWCNMRGRDAGAPPENADLARDEENFGELLQNTGYATGFAGKWQLTGSPLSAMLPDAGFDESLMWIYTGYLDPGQEYLGGYETPGKKKASRYWHPGVAKDGVHIATKEKDYGPDMFAGFCTDFIRNHADEPFLLYYPMALVHRPWLNTPGAPELKGRNKLEHLKANVEYTDKIVGEIVRTLEETGQRENTLVLFLGDNGTQTRGKNTPTEWGARVPFIASCPGVIPGSRVSRELSDISDILPTMLDFAGVPLPEGHTLDGKSLMPLLRGETQAHRDWIFSCLGQFRILRDAHWLLEANSPDDFGQFFRCGGHRDGQGYEDVTASEEPDVLAARKRFLEILKDLPFPETTREAREQFAKTAGRQYWDLNAYLATLQNAPRRKLPT